MDFYAKMKYSSYGNRFRLAEQGRAGLIVYVLGLMVYISIGLMLDFLKMRSSKLKEVTPMKNRGTKVVSTCVISILFSVWTVGANFLATVPQT